MDAIKIQSYEPQSITLNSKNKDFLIKTTNSNWRKYKNFFNLYKYGQTPIKWHNEIFKFAKKSKYQFFPSLMKNL